MAKQLKNTKEEQSNKFDKEQAKRLPIDSKELSQLDEDMPTEVFLIPEEVFATERFDTGKWENAQIAERDQHKFSYHEGLIHYAKAYKNYFHFVGLGFNLHGLNVIEVGPADFPALGYCHNWSQAWAVEPMPSEHLKRVCEEKGIGIVSLPFEELPDDNFDISKTHHKTEVWFFNLLQHVADPNEVVEKAKAIADRIRFFEPINEPVTEYHLHSFTIADFHKWFGHCETYTGERKIEGFHTADCVYGVWHKQ